MINNDLNRCFPFLMGVVLKIKSHPGYNEYTAPILIYYIIIIHVRVFRRQLCARIIYFTYSLRVATWAPAILHEIILLIIVPTDNAF